MTRREIREEIFKIIFRAEFHSGSELDEQVERAINELPMAKEKDIEYISSKASMIIDRLEDIDSTINNAAEKWKTTRMGKAELAIIRLAVYEMRYEEDIPVSVSINEAVELAKKYGADQGASFVNGVLAKLA